MRSRVGVKKVEKISVYSMHCLALVLALAAGASAFTPPAPSERPLSRRAVINPAMQFDFLKKKDAPAAAPPKKGRGKKGGDFFDDERDTTNQQVWNPQYADNGERDLATEGGIYYVAFVPFLLFGLGYLFGACAATSPRHHARTTCAAAPPLSAPSSFVRIPRRQRAEPVRQEARQRALSALRTDFCACVRAWSTDGDQIHRMVRLLSVRGGPRCR